VRASRHIPLIGVGCFPLGVLGVHHLRYLLAYGADADAQLASQGHAYLGPLSTVLVVLAACAVGGFVGRLAEAWSEGASVPPVRSFARVWVVAAAGLLAVYAGQEMLEGALAAGHPSGLAGAFGGGGLWAVPAAMAVAGVLAAVLRGERRAVEAIVSARLRAPRITLSCCAPKQAVLEPSLRPRGVALDWAAPRRGPPVSA
jgi:hypothetical protein